jgi:alpha-mannosidase
MQEIPYAAIRRENTGREWPIQQWDDLSSENAGVTLLNTGKYSMSVQGNQLRPTLLRATPYVWMYSKENPWDGMRLDWNDEDWMNDQGIQEFRLKAIFHDGDWRTAVQPPAGVDAGKQPPRQTARAAFVSPGGGRRAR